MTRRMRSKPATGLRRTRLVDVPVLSRRPVTRGALLGSTALVAGVLATAMVGLPRPAAAFDQNQCGTPSGPPYSVGCSPGYAYDTGVDYADAVVANGNFAFTIGNNTFNDSYHNPADGSDEKAAAFNIYMQNGGNFDLYRQNSEGGSTITADGIHGMWVETNVGDITFHDALLTIHATGNGTVDQTYNTGGDVVGALLSSHGGDITLQQSSIVEITSDGYGIIADTSKNYTDPTDGNISINTTYSGSEGDAGASIKAADTGILAITDGDATIYNALGHIEGGTGAGVEIAGYGNGTAALYNHSYASVLGMDGAYIHDKAQAIVDNSGGLTVGLSRDGIHIRDIGGVTGESGESAVYVYNGSGDGFAGGVIAGYWDGVDIKNVNGNSLSDGTKIFVDNSGKFDGEDVFHQGGLIYGQNGQGVDIAHTSGDVVIHNDYTLADGASITGDIPTAGLDPLSSPVLGSLSSFVTPLFGTGYVPTGIIGKDGGIKISHVGDSEGGGAVDISNQQGLIVGFNDGSDGIYINDVEGKYISEGGGYYAGVNYFGMNGVVYGDGDGFRVRNIDGNVNADNTGGVIVGLDDGASVKDVWRGDVWFGNAGGIIAGIDDGINVRDVKSGQGYGGSVNIYNGDQYGEDGGLIIGGSTAISISHVQQAWIGNATGGWILGEGSWHDPVIYLNTSRDSESGGAVIDNSGVMSSYNLPFNPDFGTFLDALDQATAIPLSTANLKPSLETLFNTEQIFADMADLQNYAWSAGAEGSIDNLASYGQAASDLLVKSDGHHDGATTINNYNLMVGRLNLDGYTYDGEDGRIGNVVNNFGTWLTVNDGHYGNELHGSSHDTINNYGLVQAAFDPNSHHERATFDVNSFNNGGMYDSVGYSGLLSLIDGGVGDKATVEGDFYGSSDNSMYRSLLGIDVRFGTEWNHDIPWFDQVDTFGKSDRLYVDGTVYGSTGLQIVKQNTAPSNAVVGDQIKVAEFGSDDKSESGCGWSGAWCKDGDTFYIASGSTNYLTVDGTGFVRDGYLMWGVKQIEDPTVYLEATAGPDLVNQPTLTTGAQNLFYSTGGVVDDHNYGNDYPQGGQGGGGADLPYAEPGQTIAAAPAGHRSAVWGRLSGTWGNQDSSFTTGGLTYDTSFDQHDYGLLAGVEMRPSTDGSGWRFGLYGGYLNSGLSFKSFGASTSYEGGTVGGYAAYLNGPLHADAEVKADFVSVDYKSPSVSASTDGTSVGILTNVAWRTQRGNVYWEPIVSFDYVNTSLGNTSSGGTTVNYADGESIRAGIGGRIGTTLGKPGQKQVDLDVMAKLWNEFGDPNTVTVSNGVTTQSYTDEISGLFGEVSARAIVYSADRMWSGFGEVSGQFGSGTTSFTGKAGVRRNF